MSYFDQSLGPSSRGTRERVPGTASLDCIGTSRPYSSRKRALKLLQTLSPLSGGIRQVDYGFCKGSEIETVTRLNPQPSGEV